MTAYRPLGLVDRLFRDVTRAIWNLERETRVETRDPPTSDKGNGSRVVYHVPKLYGSLVPGFKLVTRRVRSFS